jgi:hypothetical protein
VAQFSRGIGERRLFLLKRLYFFAKKLCTRKLGENAIKCRGNKNREGREKLLHFLLLLSKVKGRPKRIRNNIKKWGSTIIGANSGEFVTFYGFIIFK